MDTILLSRHVVLSAAIALGLPAALAQEPTVVKIALVAPLSGAQAHLGRDNENGARMAIDELNASGVSIGGKDVRFELVVMDDGADPERAVGVARTLCAAKVSGVVGHMNSGTSLAASKIYNDCRIAQITPSATNPTYSQQGFKTAFRLMASDDALGAALAQHAAQSLKLRKVAVVDDGTAYGKGVADVFKAAATKRGIQIVDQQVTTDSSTDFMGILTSIKSKAADGIFYGGMDPQAGSMLRQMDQLGMSNVKLLGGDGICTAELGALAAGAKSLGNVVCAEGGAPLERTAQGRLWKVRYDTRYPGAFQSYAPYAYDATIALANAMKSADSTDPNVYLAELAKSNFQGVTGSMAFLADGGRREQSLKFYNYADGGKVLVKADTLTVTPSQAALSATGQNREVTAFFATDRRHDPAGKTIKAQFTNDRGDQVSYGMVRVNIPPGHKMGEVERPHWLLFWQGEDLKRHMVLKSAQVVEAAAFFQALSSKMDSKIKRSFIFFHGYNVTFEDAALRTAQMAVDLQIKAVPVFYSWPSKGGLFTYTHDEQSIQWAESNIGKFLEDFAVRSKADEIFVIAHSMGGRAATQALATLLERRSDLRKRFKEIILAAPDIDAQVFKDQLLPRFPKVALPVTLYASSGDRALKVSVGVHGHARAGLAGNQMVVAPGVETVDASTVDTDFLGHSTFISSREMLADMTLLINDRMRASRRPLLQGHPQDTPQYWSFRP